MLQIKYQQKTMLYFIESSSFKIILNNYKLLSICNNPRRLYRQTKFCCIQNEGFKQCYLKWCTWCFLDIKYRINMNLHNFYQFSENNQYRHWAGYLNVKLKSSYKIYMQSLHLQNIMCTSKLAYIFVISWYTRLCWHKIWYISADTISNDSFLILKKITL